MDELNEKLDRYMVHDRAHSLEIVQNLIADESFAYQGNSLVIIELINAIKDGWRLANLAEIDRKIGDAFNKGFEEGLRACGNS